MIPETTNIYMSTWEVAGVLTKIGETACEWAKRSNLARTNDYTVLIALYEDYIFAIRQSVKAFEDFDLITEYDNRGYITRIYLTHKGHMLGTPWQVVKG